MVNNKIVIVEDEPDILEVMSYELRREGFDISTASDGIQGLSLVQRKLPELVILDVMMPGIDGIELCKKLKTDQKTSKVMVIIVSAKGVESDVVLGLGVGADDYITKPFSTREMVARVKAVLRRGLAANEIINKQVVEVNDLHIDTVKYKVFLGGKELNLTATEFRLLYYLASHPGQVFSREQLLNSSLGEGVVVGDRNIDVHIRGIRKKMDLQPPLIETIRGLGYRYKE